MYLSCFQLNIADPSVRQCLRNAHDMHRSVMSGFSDIPQPEARSVAQVLYRLEGEAPVKLYVLSASRPDWSRLKPGFCPVACSPKNLDGMAGTFSIGRRLGFDLVAIPAKKIGGDGKNSRRVFLSEADDRLEWLTRKAEQSGFSLLWCREEGQRRAIVSDRAGSGSAVHTGVRFRGELTVTDCERFRGAFQAGIGAGKAYGMGMLMLFPTES